MELIAAWLGLVLATIGALAAAWAYLGHRRARARASAAARADLERPELVLLPGVRRLHGVATRRRRAEDEVLISGRYESHLVTSKKAGHWVRKVTERNARPFDLVLPDGARVRVQLTADDWTLETRALESNTPSVRFVTFALAEGEEVWIEGTLEARPRRAGGGYRDPASRWRLSAGERPLKIWTAGAVEAIEAVRFQPTGLAIASALGLPLAVAWAGWQVIQGTAGGGTVALSVVAFSLGVAGAIAHAGGGWIGSKPWFRRTE